MEDGTTTAEKPTITGFSLFTAAAAAAAAVAAVEGKGGVGTLNSVGGGGEEEEMVVMVFACGGGGGGAIGGLAAVSTEQLLKIWEDGIMPPIPAATTDMGCESGSDESTGRGVIAAAGAGRGALALGARRGGGTRELVGAVE